LAYILSPLMQVVAIELSAPTLDRQIRAEFSASSTPSYGTLTFEYKVTLDY
jgi:hypothetical protein